MKILTDSAADMDPAEIRELGVTIASLTIHFPEGEVISDQLTPDEFYTRLRAMEPRIPTTSQPSSGKFVELYKSLSDGEEEILSIHISSGLSGTIESARAAKAQLPNHNITVVDSLTLSGGERFQVIAAALCAKADMSRDAILERLKAISRESELVYTLDTLTYLARGGRIGRVQALAGALLKIKPIISVDKTDGKYNNEGRSRTIRGALDLVIDHHFKAFGSSTPVWVTVLHGQFAEQAEVLKQLIQERLNVARIETMRVSPVLGVHTGPGVVGAAVLPMELVADLF
jgi:DegV family protein with EDD domain